MAPQQSKDAYTVGWIAALYIEQAAAIAMLDETHEKPLDFEKSDGDDNTYTWGRVGAHNVVIASLPDGEYGQVSAAATAKVMAMSFPIRLGLLVGIGGGIPQIQDEVDIRLGDIVVSRPGRTHGGVVQYDIGKTTAAGFEPFGHLNAPPTALLKAVSRLRAEHERNESQIPDILKDMLAKNAKMAKSGPNKPSYKYQGQEHDRLFQDDYQHKTGRTCTACDLSKEVQRETREDLNPVLHYGTIATGNVVIKNTADRMEVLRRVGNDCLCVETEAAGLMNNFPCLVVRGICDYADTHKNDRWQRYAAATAAAYAKELLGVLDGGEVSRAKTVKDVLSESLDEISHKIEDIDTKTTQTNEVVGTISNKGHQDDIQRWLSPPDPSTNYQQALRQRHHGSGQWLIQDARYLRWEKEQSSFMWLNGIPGCGKTVLSSTVVENLKKDPSTKAVLYFYFDFSDIQKQALESIIRSFINQLYHSNQPSVQKPLDICFASHKNGQEQPSLGSLRETLRQMADQAGDLWIVVDALEECMDQDRHRGALPDKQNHHTGNRCELLDWIQDLHTGASNIHLLVTSRPEPDIKSAMEQKWASKVYVIPLQSELVQHDISSYVQWQVRHGERLRRWRGREEMQQLIENTLLNMARGMFRWVSCQLDVLQDCRDPPTIRKTLVSLPKTLDETYSRILANLQETNLHAAKRLLQCLAFSRRPLEIQEAIDIIAVDINASRKPRFDPGNRMPNPQEITDYCPGLIIIVPATRRNTRGEENIVYELQLAHFSVKEYLLSSRIDTMFAGDLQETIASTVIAQTCLAYLLELPSIADTHWLCESYPLAYFAANHWAEFAAKDGKHSGSIVTLAMELFENRRAYLTWGGLIEPNLEWMVFGDRQICNPLNYVALCGLDACVRQMLVAGADVNAQGDGYFGNALQAASSSGHLNIVNRLLAAGAEVNTQSGDFGNALQAASSSGHLDTVNRLLAAGAEVNTQGGYFGNALQVASTSGYLDIVNRLLEAGAEVNAQGGLCGNALQVASSSGHLDIVNRLLAAGAEVNAQGGLCGNALQAASSSGHLDIVNRLLAAGAEVNAQGGMHGANALQEASRRGHLDIVNRLLVAGAEVNAQGGLCGNALQAASSSGYLDIFNRLPTMSTRPQHFRTATREAGGQGRLRNIKRKAVELSGGDS